MNRQRAQPPGRAAGPAGRAPPAAGTAWDRATARSQGGKGKGCGTPQAARSPALTVDVLPVADVLQVAARILPAQLGLGAVGLQPGVGIPAQLGAGGDAAGGGVPHLLCPGPARLRRRRGAAGQQREAMGTGADEGQQQEKRQRLRRPAAALAGGSPRRFIRGGSPAARPAGVGCGS